MKSLRELAEFVGGTIVGRQDLMISGVSGVECSNQDKITFAENAELHKKAEASDAAAVIVSRKIEQSTKTLLQVDNPRLAYAKIAHLFMPRPYVNGQVHPTCIIDPEAWISEEVSIHAHAVIGAGAKIGQRSVIGPGVYIGKGVEIGTDCEIHANVVIEYDTKIGNRVIVHGGTVIGSDGFGFVTVKEGHYKIPQLGNVIIEDDVEIGANVTIDRAANGSTKVGRGTKIDNLVHLAHNVEIGPESLIIAQVGVAGSTKLGSRVTLAGQAGVFGHLQVGSNVIAAARSVISANIEDGAFISGHPAIDHKEDYRIKAAGRKVPELIKQVRAMEKRLAELEGKIKEKNS